MKIARGTCRDYRADVWRVLVNTCTEARLFHGRRDLALLCNSTIAQLHIPRNVCSNSFHCWHYTLPEEFDEYRAFFLSKETVSKTRNVPTWTMLYSSLLSLLWASRVTWGTIIIITWQWAFCRNICPWWSADTYPVRFVQLNHFLFSQDIHRVFRKCLTFGSSTYSQYYDKTAQWIYVGKSVVAQIQATESVEQLTS